jgi:hypothetical protein
MASHTAGQFFRAFIHCLSWPRSAAQWPAIFYLAPWVILMARQVKNPSPPDRRIAWICALGLWSVLQMAAISIGRKDDPPPRYTDIFAIWAAANLAASLFLLEWRDGAGRPRWIPAAAGLWAVAIAVGLCATVRAEWVRRLPAWGRDNLAYEHDVAGYVASGDSRFLQGPIPYPAAAPLARMLDLPELRAILPTSVAPPLELKTRSGDFTIERVPFGQDPMAGRRLLSAHSSADRVRRWESQALTSPGGGYWQFLLQGTPGIAVLEVRDVATQRLLGSVRWSPAKAGGWSAATIRAPEGAVTLDAACPAGSTFSFYGPVRMSAPSLWAMRLAEHGPWLVAAGALVLALPRPKKAKAN